MYGCKYIFFPSVCFYILCFEKYNNCRSLFPHGHRNINVEILNYVKFRIKYIITATKVLKTGTKQYIFVSVFFNFAGIAAVH